MAWNLHIEAAGADDQLTAGQAATLKSAVVTALAGIQHTRASFVSDVLPGQTGLLEPPMPASVTLQSKSECHTATRN